jgi:hypothetical protein
MLQVKRLLVALGACVAIGALSAACSAKAKAVAVGGECMLAVDCEPGLACVPQRDGRRICDSDLSGAQRLYDAGRAPQDAAVGEAGTEGGHEGGESGVDAARPDASDGAVRDVTPPEDSGDDGAMGTDAPPE